MSSFPSLDEEIPSLDESLHWAGLLLILDAHSAQQPGVVVGGGDVCAPLYEGEHSLKAKSWEYQSKVLLMVQIKSILLPPVVLPWCQCGLES